MCSQKAESVKFEVEDVLVLQLQAEAKLPVVFARNVDKLDFEVTGQTMLGGHRIIEAQIPRSVDAMGNPRLDYWAFRLESPEAVREFSKGDIVELTNTK